MTDDEPRVAVLILCRLSAGGARRLGNVLEIGMSSVIIEIDDPPALNERVSISVVVPGIGVRVSVDGVVEQQGPVGCLVKIMPPVATALAEFVKRRVAAGDVDVEGPAS